jgi:hypothetical protein
MEQETSTFEPWLRTVGPTTRGLPLADALDVVAQRAAEAFGARLWFVEILGRRWSYVAGQRSERPAAAAIERIRLGGNIGLVSDDWGMLMGHESSRLVAFLRQLVASEQPR